MQDEMPGFFPGRPGGEHDEPLLDMILERRPIPPGAPPEIHGLARMFAAVAGPAEPGDLPGQAAALAAFTRLTSPPGTSPAALRSARRSLSERPARGRLPLAVALAAAAAGLGSTAAAYVGVLPSPIQHFAYVTFGAPAPPLISPCMRSRSPVHRRTGTPTSGLQRRREGIRRPSPIRSATRPIPGRCTITGGRETVSGPDSPAACPRSLRGRTTAGRWATARTRSCRARLRTG